jgi:hypothetical protein
MNTEDYTIDELRAVLTNYQEDSSEMAMRIKELEAERAEAIALLQGWAINAGHLDICALQNGSHCTCGLTETVRWLKGAQCRS